MQSPSRRRLLRFAAASAAASAHQAWPAAIRKALALAPREGAGSLADVEHVIVLMQENRSFDHYFGTLRGVRGFGDPRPDRLPDGRPVWEQPADGGAQLPFRPDLPGLGLRFLEGTPHDWATTQRAANGGRHDGWIAAKGRATMAHLKRRDIPFHHALADAFTICDAYHCALLGPTDPNRYHLWTGWTGNDGTGGGPVVTNAEAGYAWTTFPERLERAGISWRVYQDEGLGLDAAGAWGCTQDATIGNYGDNSLLYFKAYRDARPGDPLYERARRGTRVASRPGERLLDDLRADIGAGRLPQVAWIVAPEAYSEHPNWPPNYGAWYIAQVLDALTANPAVWARTALFITYDENDGFFDHVIPPTPDAARGRSTVDTALERYAGDAANPAGPFGLGMRVPMLVVSPWTRGGWVCSEVFDHTSILRFVERRFGGPGTPVFEPNITPWRRAVCGDLTSAFDFGASAPDAAADINSALPPTVAYTPADRARHPDFALAPFAASAGALPRQEPGTRPARPLPYDLEVRGEAAGAGWQFSFANRGRAGAHFRVSASMGDAPRGYTVEAGKALQDLLPAAAGGRYDWVVTGPGSFHREFAGRLGGAEPRVHGVAPGGATPRLRLALHNPGEAPVELRLAAPLYREIKDRSIRLRPHETRTVELPLQATQGWYDLLVTQPADAAYRRRLAGLVQTGRPSISDPAFGAPG